MPLPAAPATMAAACVRACRTSGDGFSLMVHSKAAISLRKYETGGKGLYSPAGEVEMENVEKKRPIRRS